MLIVKEFQESFSWKIKMSLCVVLMPLMSNPGHNMNGLVQEARDVIDIFGYNFFPSLKSLKFCMCFSIM